jgi:hypothetical protein
MALRLVEQSNLAVLQLSIDRSNPEFARTGGCAVFTLQVSGETVFELICPCKDMNLPLTLRQAANLRYSEPEYRIPEYVLHGIEDALIGVLGEGVPLWLEFTDDCGNLPLVPWERLLEPTLNIPILRLPYFSLKPFSSATSCLDIVVCASMPAAKSPFPVEEIVDNLTRRIQEVVRRDMMIIHVFSDAAVYPNLQYLLKGRFAPRDGSGIRLYNPERARRYSIPEPSSNIQETPEDLGSPWLQWIVDSLGHRSADVVHFICHGYLNSQQGALAFAESPVVDEDRRLARFVGPQQLTTFTQRIGAWSIGFSSPENNFSAPGLRLLADQIARLRPGPVLIHETIVDSNLIDVGEAYRFLYNAEQDTLPSSAAVGLYSHPARVRQLSPDIAQTEQAQELSDYTLAKGQTLQILEAHMNTPVWVASSQRYLEQSAAEVLSAGQSSAAQSPTQAGEEEALKLLADVLERHATSSLVPNTDAEPAPGVLYDAEGTP